MTTSRDSRPDPTDLLSAIAFLRAYVDEDWNELESLLSGDATDLMALSTALAKITVTLLEEFRPAGGPSVSEALDGAQRAVLAANAEMRDDDSQG